MRTRLFLISAVFVCSLATVPQCIAASEVNPYAPYRAGKVSEARAEYQRLADEAVRSGTAIAKWHALMNLGWIDGVTGNYRTAIETTNQALAVTDEVKAPFLRGRSLVFLGHYFASMGNYPVALELFSKVNEIAAPEGKPVMIPIWGFATQETGRVLFEMGNVAAARQTLETTLNYAREREIDVGIAEGGAELSEIALSQGNVGEAESLAREAFAASERCGCNDFNTARAMLALTRALFSNAPGNVDRMAEAATWLEKTERFATKAGAKPVLAHALMLRSRVLPPDSHEERLALLQRALELVTESEHETRGTVEGAVGSAHRIANDFELANFYVARGIEINHQLLRAVDNAYLTTESAALDLLKGDDGNAVRKYDASYETALQTDQGPLALEKAGALAETYARLGFTALAGEWARRAESHAVALLAKDASPERKSALKAKQIQLREISVQAQIAGISDDLPPPQ